MFDVIKISIDQWREFDGLWRGCITFNASSSTIMLSNPDSQTFVMPKILLLPLTHTGFWTYGSCTPLQYLCGCPQLSHYNWFWQMEGEEETTLHKSLLEEGRDSQTWGLVESTVLIWPATSMESIWFCFSNMLI